MAGTGRPRLSADEKRRHLISVYFSAAELRDVMEGAAQHGEKLPRYIRRRALGGQPPRSVGLLDPEWRRQVVRVGSNLNQFIRHLNSGHILDHDLATKILSEVQGAQELISKVLDIKDVETDAEDSS